MKYLIPMVVAFVVVQMTSTVVQAERISRITADIQGDEASCVISTDCKYSDEACVYSGESEGHTGVCIREDKIEVQFETTGADKEYVHGDHCIDGRTF